MTAIKRLTVWTRRSGPVALLLLLFALSRLLFIFTSEHASHVEECKQVALGVDLSRGHLQLPFWLYLDSPHAGGSNFAGLISAPFFALFGDIFAAAKISSLALSMLTIWLIHGLIRRETGAGGGLSTLVLVPLLVISTPHYLQKSVIFTGNILELVLGAVILTWLHLVALRRPHQPWWYAAMGVVAGLGLWIQLGTVAIIGTVLLFWFLNDRLFVATRQFALFALGAALGFSPFIIYNITYDFIPMRLDQFSSQSSFLIDPLEVTSRLGHLLAVDIPRSFHFFAMGPVDGRIMAYTLYGVCAAAGLWLVIRGRARLRRTLAAVAITRRRAAEPIVPSLAAYWSTYLLVTVVLFGISPMPLGTEGSTWNSMDAEHEYYLLFLQPLLFAVAAIGLVDMLRSGSAAAHRAGAGALLLVTLVTLPCFASLLGTGQLNPKMLRSHACVCGNVRETGMTFRGHPPMIQQLLAELSPPYRPYLLQGAGFGWYLQSCDVAKSFPPAILNEGLQRLSGDQRRALLWSLLNTPADSCPMPWASVISRVTKMLDRQYQPLFQQLILQWRSAPAPMAWTDCFDREKPDQLCLDRCPHGKQCINGACVTP